jgi:hypothetical protein
MSALSNGEAFAVLINRWKSQVSSPSSSSAITNQNNQSYSHKSTQDSGREASNSFTLPWNLYKANQSGPVSRDKTSEHSPYQPQASSYRHHSRDSYCKPHEPTSYCEPCDKEMPLSAYNAHIASHEKCHHPNCTFSATKKVVSAHYHSVHGAYSGSGYKTIIVENQPFRVLLGCAPEEIEQWRAERRKRYPSIANITAKEDETRNFITAGGIIRHNSDYKQSNRKSNHTNKKRPREEAVQPRAEAFSSVDPQQIQLPSSTGELTSPSSNAGNELTIEPISMLEEEGEVIELAPMMSTTVLEIPVNPSLQKDSSPTRRLCHNHAKGHCKRGSKCKFLHEQKALKAKDRPHQSSPAVDESRPGKRQHGLFLPAPLSGGKHGSLLQHLLKDSIEEEEQLLLQSFRYLTQQNFFDN